LSCGRFTAVLLVALALLHCVDAWAADPRSRDVLLRDAQAALWSGDYAKARPLFAELVERNAGDVEARLGLAQAAYWSGDYRQALRELEAILRLRPDHAEAQRSVREIRSTARPGFTIDTGVVSDDQPYRTTSGGASVYFFSDPLTKWLFGAAGTRLRSGGLSREAREIFASVEDVVPAAGIRLRAGGRWLRFPDDRNVLLPSLSIERRAGRARVGMTLERRELLRTATALRSHPFASVVAIRWSREQRFAVNAESLRYFDGNRGMSADAFVLAPAGRFSFGASAAWKDTRDSRFRADTGAYDPYWTPQDLREVRAIAAGSLRLRGVTIDLHLDGGIARDRVLDFHRTFHPWRASFAAGIPLNGQAGVHVSIARSSTVFYTANEIDARLVGRF